MSNPFQLFIKRLIFDLLEIYKVFKVVADWTVTLYIIVPNSIIFIAFYIEWWTELPSLFQTLTYNKLLILTFLTFFLNDIKSFIYTADQLFFIQNKELLRKISLYGFMYSLVITFITTTIFAAILLPVLINQFHFSIQLIIWFYLYYFSSYVVFLIVRKIIKIYNQSFLLRVLSFSIALTIYISFWHFSLSSISVKILIIILLIMITIILSKKILFSGKQFLKLVDLDEIIRNKWTRFVLWQGGHTKLLNSRHTYKPWILKSSKFLFKQNSAHNILTDAFIKSFIRDNNTVLTFLQLITLLITALFLLSNFWVRFIIWGFAVYVIIEVLKNSWLAFRNSSFINMLHWNDHDLFRSLKKSIYIVAFPFVFIVGAIFGYLDFTLAGVIICPFISIILALIIIRYSNMLKYKEHKHFKQRNNPR